MTRAEHGYPVTPGFVAGSDTSEAAAKSIAAPSLRARTYAYLVDAEDGLTSDELEVLTGWPHQTASARLRELVLAGLARDGRERRRTRNGRFAVVRHAVLSDPQQRSLW
jgi:hypothetical protein